MAADFLQPLGDQFSCGMRRNVEQARYFVVFHLIHIPQINRLPLYIAGDAVEQVGDPPFQALPFFTLDLLVEDRHIEPEG